jgi:aldose 1-epimerase
MISIKTNENKKDIITLENEYLKVVVTNYGCRILSIIMDDCHHQKSDVVLGYDNLEQYETEDGYLGAFVGRVANRVGKGCFTLNNKTYHLAINNGPNSLHGGIVGLDQKIFHYETTDDSVIFSTMSPHLEEGYPGDLIVNVTYTLKDKSLIVRYQAASNVDTMINFTNHSYFNLSNEIGEIDNHILYVNADKFNHIDQDGLTIKEEENVENTPFDYRKPTRIGDLIHLSHPQLELGKGYDHHFIFNSKENQVILYEPTTKRKLTVSTTLPGAQIYSANYLDGKVGKSKVIYNPRYAICIETQNRPDAIHIEENPSTILKRNEWYDETTTYTFEVE